MLTERHCIVSKLEEADLLSAQMIISCDALDFGCSGGHLDATMDFLSEFRVPKVACDPMRFSYLERALDWCVVDEDESQDICAIEGLKCSRHSKVEMTTEAEIKREILANGPITSKMLVFDDLATKYVSGVYSLDIDEQDAPENTLIGSHAVLIVGWG
mmetsp:Transcript_12399/g.15825  ORF Transcript_12399/g.15825 Transcript_12399/m.15825 type:complete len:158 (+) Transcript_12399:307-780(+)|eukprot:CAMPEP_0170454070 /NCGR_PEP_ID=MMETSP0123-20130129/2443_1 /TAXON_ID=182087 /ORGANISM="Favella ehrenbergii, Strain Fehren 1" /LENGTH=157 /DNA_ID=CAMNT_0010716657 /DNA_START=235 /DNA_END=708 /DNA_ORIENTATION=+